MDSSTDDLINSTPDTPFFSLDGLECNGKITQVYDGDTCHCNIQLPDGKITQFKVRLIGLDTPEIRPRRSLPNRDEEIHKAMLARNFLVSQVTDIDIDIDDYYSKKDLNELIKENSKIVKVMCHEWDKYGRLLATFYTDDNDTSVNDLMIQEGHGYAYDGGKKQ